MKLLKNIETLAYGNLNRLFLPYLTNDSMFSSYTDVFTDNEYPNLKTGEREIQSIIEIQNEYIQKPTWRKYQDFMVACDVDMKDVMYKRLNKIGLNFTKANSDLLEEIQEEVGVLAMQLKKHYNRARPYQIAYYTGQDLHPFNTITGNTPAYPSGHAMQSRFLLKIVAFNFPKYKDEIKKLANDIAFTRIVMGVHFQSDNDFGFKIADKLATYPQIIDKYFTNKIF
jgi:hypothetical protein